MLIRIPSGTIGVNHVLMPAFGNNGFVKATMLNVRIINATNALVF